MSATANHTYGRILTPVCLQGDHLYRVRDREGTVGKRPKVSPLPVQDRFLRLTRNIDTRPLRKMTTGWLRCIHFVLHRVTMSRGPSDEQQFEAFEIG